MKTIKKIQRITDKTTTRYFIRLTSDYTDATFAEKELILTKARNWKNDASFFLSLSTVFILGAFLVKSLILV